ncbi:patatin-like phospholipase family protein [Methylocystis sp. 9N]|uniref:Patatin-like phospholipase family protein n=1 Tax=Methylocystis borbori TaxID=3118750 RepID=A0ABU7XFH4_9HYPH
MRPTYEIGLVLSGAISAGAYTAGVMDFLIEALDAYEEAKGQAGWDGPTHNVRIPIMAGASAGGMTAAIAALHTFRRLEHVWPGKPIPPDTRNRLYSSWVRDIDIMRLLETTDLDGVKASAGVKSALCCDVIDEIVANAFNLSGELRQPNWVGRGDERSLRVMFTLTNLRGVPYSFQLFGTNDPRRYGMLNHGDYLDFNIGVEPRSIDGALSLDIQNTVGDGWDLFRTGAKATGAFPMGLAPRYIERPPTDYWHSDRVGFETDGGFTTVDPDDWVGTVKPYAFVSVDGGTIDNEPLELARRYLAGAGGKNERAGDKASKSVILISPFPNYQKTTLESRGEKLVDVVPRLLSTLVDQARFKPAELELVQNEDVYSRYMIAPEREPNAHPDSKLYPIACGVLGGFGGFLHQSFRRHDYLLGRRNAQAFFRANFALPVSNPLFNEFPQERRDKWLVRDIKTGALKTYATKNGEEYGLPIIPLIEPLSEEIKIEAADLPKPQVFHQPDVRSALQAAIQRRAETVVGALVDNDLKDATSGFLGYFKRLGAKRFGTDFAVGKANASIFAAIDDVTNAFYEN